MAPFYGLRSRLGLTDIRERLGMIKRPPTPLQTTIDAAALGTTTGGAAGGDPALTIRIIAAYKSSVAGFPGYGESMWLSINKLATPMHDLLMSADVDEVSDALNHPHRSNLSLDSTIRSPRHGALSMRIAISCPTRSALI